MNRVALFGFLNVSALLAAIFHARQLNGTFYAASVYFAESRLCMIVLGSFGLYCMFLAWKLIKGFFLGPLRLIEREHVTEYSWIVLSETFLAMTIFKNEIDSIFVFSFAFLMCFKVFHWIIRDRIDYMEQVIQLPMAFLYKIGGLLSLLIFGTAFMMTGSVVSVLRKGPSMAILFANEYALTMVSLIGSAIRFSLNCFDTLNPEEPFEQRSTVIFYLDFFVDLCKLLIYTGFFAVVMAFYGLPIHIIRDLYVTVISFTKRVRDMVNYHQIMSTLQSRYPDVTAEELAACNDPTCIICREEMTSSVKRLPCGHFFHFKCLKSWLERQQVCPTCRKSVLEAVKPAPAVVQAPVPQEPLYPGNYRPSWSETTATNSPSMSNNTSVTNNSRILFSPLRRSHSASSLLPVLLDDERNGEEELLLSISESEKLKVAAELERIGRRSRSPLHHQFTNVPSGASSSDSSESSLLLFSAASSSSPLSPLSHVKSKIEYVEELMGEHEKILQKLRQVESEIVRGRSFRGSLSRSLSREFEGSSSQSQSESESESERDEKGPPEA